MPRPIINHYNHILLSFLTRSLFVNAVMGIESTTISFVDDNCSDTTANSFVELNDTLLERFLAVYPVRVWKEHGFFNENYLKEINQHWLQFMPPSRRSHLILAGCYVLIMIIGIFGNLLVIILFARRKSIRTPANVLVVNLAISDFLMMSKMPIFIYNSIYEGPALGKYACRYFGFIGGLSGTVSICTLAAISLDRYYVIKYPLNRNLTYTKIKFCLAMLWIYGATFSIVPLLNVGLGNYVPEGYLTSCSFDYLTNSLRVKLFIFVFFVAAWLIPFVIIAFSYINIIYVVTTTRNVLKQKTDSGKHVSAEAKRHQDVHLASIVFLIICLWFVAWTPYATIALMGIFGSEKYITPLSSMIPALFCKSASCIDPFVYALTHPRFKLELKRSMCHRTLERGYTANTRFSSSYRSPRRSRTGSNQSGKRPSTPQCESERISLVKFKGKL